MGGGGGVQGGAGSRTTVLCFMSHERNNVIMCLGDLCGAIGL